MKTKEEVNKEASEAFMAHLKAGNRSGTIVADMGTGKTKTGLDIAIKELDVLSCLVVSPRGNLTKEKKEVEHSWKKELSKWYPPSEHGRFKFDTIQNAYKWEGYHFDLIIIDEAHECLTPKYSDLLRNNDYKYLLCLTGTAGLEVKGKKELYEEFSPIIYEYLDSAEDGLINKTRVFVLDKTLDDRFRVMSGSKKKPFKQGELSKYDYLSSIIAEAQDSLYGMLSVARQNEKAQYKEELLEGRLDLEDLPYQTMNLWDFAVLWGYGKKAPDSQSKSVAMRYLNHIAARKKLLNNLPSNAFYARIIKEAILEENQDNKVLIFTQEIKQAEQISDKVYHSNMEDDEKEANLSMFDEGMLRELASSKGLILGLNIDGATHGILESYNGSSTLNAQKKGRLHRLSAEKEAKLVIIRNKDTQQDRWFEKMLPSLNTENITYYSDVRKLIKDLCPEIDN